uniref:Uncharacterized protein n=1 Tax=Tanacetum cinerariifolium TaxID=118510 RepID=A0A6L2JNZ3_TANCI|nr:hypothetical protein [Tanacetum cinerariifolium]
MESILEDEDAMDEGVAAKLKKRKLDDADKMKALPLDQTEGTSISQPKSTGDSAQVKETAFEAGDTQGPQNLREDAGNTDEPPLSMLIQRIGSRNRKDLLLQILSEIKISKLTHDILVGSAYNILKGTCRTYVELDYNMEECYKSLADQLDWNNPEGDRYLFYLSKPLPLVMSRNHKIVPVDCFFNNDLAYLQGGSTNRTYTTLLTKINAAKYDLPGIKDMVPNLWSLIKVSYDNHALLGTSHWGPKRQSFYVYASNRMSIHDVYFTKRILAVKNVNVKEWYGYGHFKEIEVQRSDQQLYKFMKGDFPQLHLHDIEDMLVLLV